MDERNPFMKRLRASAARDTLGHAVILSGGSCAERMEAARLTAAAMECRGEQPPCGICGACRKVTADLHPDVTWVKDPEHKILSVGVVRAVRSDAYVLPNEGARKVYVFPDCGLLDARGQNILLKVVEEGPAHAAFLFCAENSAVLLPTLRSRCVEWKLDGAAPVPDSGAAELCGLLDRRDPVAIAAFFTGVEMKKMGREELQELLAACRELLAASLLAASGCGGENRCPHLDRWQLNRAVELLGRQAGQLRFNLGVGHAAGALAVELGALVRPQS